MNFLLQNYHMNDFLGFHNTKYTLDVQNTQKCSFLPESYLFCYTYYDPFFVFFLICGIYYSNC